MLLVAHSSCMPLCNRTDSGARTAGVDMECEPTTDICAESHRGHCGYPVDGESHQIAFCVTCVLFLARD